MMKIKIFKNIIISTANLEKLKPSIYIKYLIFLDATSEGEKKNTNKTLKIM